MDILSIEYFCLLFISTFVYWIFNKHNKIIMLIFSIGFLLLFGIKTFLLTISYALLTYIISNIKINTKLAIIIDLLPLLFAKYLIKIVNRYLNIEIALISIVGISYLSFKAISYLVDTKNNKCDKCNIFDYLLYMLFFPTILSGPIEKPGNFIAQINEKKEFCKEKMDIGIIYILYGLFMKIVIANRLYVFVSYIYSINDICGYLVILAILLYPLYIYCDFCGYSYIAKGTGSLFCYNIVNNFNHPYLSTSIKEFWNRWHISLNIWLRDYIYIPLGGNRNGKIRKYINILIVFGISGIWHGAGFGFIAWGLLNGIYQIIGDLTIDKRNSIYEKLKLSNTKFQKILRTIFVYFLISFSWILFDQGIKNTIKILFSFYKSPLIEKNQIIAGLLSCGFGMFEKIEWPCLVLSLSILIMIVVDIVSEKKDIINILLAKKQFKKDLFYIAFIILIIYFGYFNNGAITNFIYFDF